MTSVPAPQLYPSFNVVRFSHVTFQVTDLAASRKFYVDTLGLQVTQETDEMILCRGMEERNMYSVALRRSVVPEVPALGLRVFAEQDLDGVHAHFAGQGLLVEWRECELRGRVLFARDPLGTPLEFHAQMATAPSDLQHYAKYHGAKPLRIDHANVFCPDVDAATQFYSELGFRLTEYTQDDESGRLWATWMHRKGSSHDIAFTNGTGPRLHHIALWVPTPMNIIDVLDLMSTTGYLANIERGPGRHGITNAFFLYVRDPDEHRIELYCSDYQTVDPDQQPIRWSLKDPQRQTLWGAPAPRSWFEEGSNFCDTSVSESTLSAEPIVAR